MRTSIGPAASSATPRAPSSHGSQVSDAPVPVVGVADGERLGGGLGAAVGEGLGEADGVGEGDGEAVPSAGSVYSGGPAKAGVGSKGTQPSSSKNSSGHACASCAVTSYEPSSRRSPGVKPTAIRAGMPSSRAMVIMAAEKWMQYPARSPRRKLEIASAPVVDGASRV